MGLHRGGSNLTLAASPRRGRILAPGNYAQKGHIVARAVNRRFRKRKAPVPRTDRQYRVNEHLEYPKAIYAPEHKRGDGPIGIANDRAEEAAILQQLGLPQNVFPVSPGLAPAGYAQAAPATQSDEDRIAKLEAEIAALRNPQPVQPLSQAPRSQQRRAVPPVTGDIGDQSPPPPAAPTGPVAAPVPQSPPGGWGAPQG